MVARNVLTQGDKILTKATQPNNPKKLDPPENKNDSDWLRYFVC